MSVNQWIYRRVPRPLGWGEIVGNNVARRGYLCVEPVNSNRGYGTESNSTASGITPRRGDLTATDSVANGSLNSRPLRAARLVRA